MKKIIYGFGVVFLFLLLVGAVLVGYMAIIGPRLDASSKDYVDKTVPKIVATWSVDELLGQGCARFKQGVSDAQLRQIFVKLSTLGSLVTYEGSKGDARVNFSPKDGRVVMAAYQAKARFERGDATINITLLQVDGQWQILGFYVLSPALLK